MGIRTLVFDVSTFVGSWKFSGDANQCSNVAKIRTNLMLLPLKSTCRVRVCAFRELVRAFGFFGIPIFFHWNSKNYSKVLQSSRKPTSNATQTNDGTVRSNYDTNVCHWFTPLRPHFLPNSSNSKCPLPRWRWRRIRNATMTRRQQIRLTRCTRHEQSIVANGNLIQIQVGQTLTQMLQRLNVQCVGSFEFGGTVLRNFFQIDHAMAGHSLIAGQWIGLVEVDGNGFRFGQFHRSAGRGIVSLVIEENGNADNETNLWLLFKLDTRLPIELFIGDFFTPSVSVWLPYFMLYPSHEDPCFSRE